jgi:lipoate-protein ligase A
MIAVETEPGVAMATDAAMLAEAEKGQPSIRLYAWGAVCVTLGQNQSPERALVDPTRVAWAHRPTGGSAVLHGHDATLTVAVPAAVFGEGHRPRVRTVYRALAQVAAEFLTINGLESKLAEDAENGVSEIKSEACFSSTSRNDLVDREGRKVCGCALRITRMGALLQTSIPMHLPAVVPGNIITGAISVTGPVLTIRMDKPNELAMYQVLASRSA